ncbi:HlyD family secretion protein [Janthinobacterium sp.]|uniref:HlyD family secretion protein n=1 Tax=Janthinobacterium sp. TaxID=1871054 RepID=UPI00293D9822|nr:HlyD family efflux transporter periplasmic adaptor subunit [Janthinobacterium sp.]
MSQPSLFRPAALEARQVNWLADVVLLRPLSFSVLTLLALAFAAVIVGFLAVGSYTKRTPVSGQLVPDAGLLKVYTPQPGVVLQKFVAEGQAVKRGEVLYVLSGERQSGTQANIQAAISGQVEARRESLRAELEKGRAMQGDERAALQGKIAGLEAELAKLAGQIEDQRRRVKLAEDSVARYQGLLAQDYISREQAQQKQEELLDQRNRARAIEREQISLGRELALQRNELATLAPRQQNRLAQVERGIASAGQELSESEAKRRLLVTAPQAGVATAPAAEVGQWMDASQPLLSVVPAGAVLQAQLYAPSKAVGFIRPGDAVLLRYQAFPYQKFGHAKGRVASVSRTALPAAELRGAGAGNEALYRVTVTLAAQSMPAYGKAQPLQAGMLLDADILQETRRLYEWVLEPLYSLSGKL